AGDESVRSLGARCAESAGDGAQALMRAFERIVGAVTWVATALSAAGVLTALAFVAYGVVMRYVFNAAPAWVDDTVGYMLVGIVMLAAATTLRQGAHINVDILTGNLRGTPRRVADAWSMLAVLVFAIV